MFSAVHRVLRLPTRPLVESNTARVERWLHRHSICVGASPMFWPGLWRVSDDTDGSVLLLPLCDADPGLAIMPSAAGYEVLICDPDDMEEIGPFDTIEEALDGIKAWFALPCRSIELPADRNPRLSRLQ